MTTSFLQGDVQWPTFYCSHLVHQQGSRSETLEDFYEAVDALLVQSEETRLNFFSQNLDEVPPIYMLGICHCLFVN